MAWRRIQSARDEDALGEGLRDGSTARGGRGTRNGVDAREHRGPDASGYLEARGHDGDPVGVLLVGELGERETLHGANHEGRSADDRNVGNGQEHGTCRGDERAHEDGEHGYARETRRQQKARAVLVVDASRQRRHGTRAQDGGKQREGGDEWRRPQYRLHEGGHDDVHGEDGDKGEHVRHDARRELGDLQGPQVDERLGEPALPAHEQHEGDGADDGRCERHGDASAEHGRHAVEDADERDADERHRCRV